MSKNTEKATKSSSAEYPVDPAERISQEARLRKAAAAGASTSKSPIPGLMLQPPPPVAGSAKTAAPQPVLSKTASSTETTPETRDHPSAPHMNSDEVLAELRKISAWADQQRKFNRRLLIFVAFLVPVVIGIFVLTERRLKTELPNNLSSHESDWNDVDRNIRLGDFEKAIAIGEELILKTPQYPEAHQRLARAYVAAGKLDRAKEHYAEAFRLFPSEDNEKSLSAIEKRLSNGSTNGTSNEP